MRFYLSLSLGKLVLKLSQLIPFIGGTALPGLLALKLDPDFLKTIVEKNQLQSIIITGTNGKTTTARLLSTILTQAAKTHIQNRTGSNLLRGIASSLISHSSATGKLKTKLAIWEVDEAVAPQAFKQLKPKIILFTNLFRDQLDRYGEIDTILTNWQSGLKTLPKTSTLIVNLDDPSLHFLSLAWPGELITFGLNLKKTRKSLANSADAIFCPNCLKPLTFTKIYTSHLGAYSCTSCDFSRPKPNLTLTNQSQIPAKLPGIYNLYNLLAATAIAKNLKLSQLTINRALKNFQPAFGRAETFSLFNRPTNILLVKNPAGFNTVLETLKAKKELATKPLLMILNDLIADGTDVSWIWDVDFSLLKLRKKPIIVSGIRAYDLSLRLKYAGLKTSRIIIQPSIPKALNSLKTLTGSPINILPTYTAMLALREHLRKMKLIHSTWED